MAHPAPRCVCIYSHSCAPFFGRIGEYPDASCSHVSSPQVSDIFGGRWTAPSKGELLRTVQTDVEAIVVCGWTQRAEFDADINIYSLDVRCLISCSCSISPPCLCRHRSLTGQDQHFGKYGSLKLWIMLMWNNVFFCVFPKLPS